MTGFLAQGGYAFYVWLSYAVSLAALGSTAVLTILAHRKAKHSLRQLEARRPL
jgi:heme exporter protein CcmD